MDLYENLNRIIFEEKIRDNPESDYDRAVNAEYLKQYSDWDRDTVKIYKGVYFKLGAKFGEEYFKDRMSKLTEENARYKEALEYYAQNISNWSEDDADIEHISLNLKKLTYGKRARKALKGDE